MVKNMKNRLRSKLLYVPIICICLMLFSSCCKVVRKDYNIERDNNFGAVKLLTSIDDFNLDGFTFGDSIDIRFSNGQEVLDIPYFNGYYTKTGELEACGYPGYTSVYVSYTNSGSLYDELKLNDKDIASVTLNEKGKYLNIQEAFNIKYSDSRDNYNSDERFSNFRSLSGGNLKENTFYRGASPIDNEHNRPSIVNKLIQEVGINFILDLADSQSEIDSYIINNPEEKDYYFMKLLENDNVALLNLDAAYRSEDYCTNLINGLRVMMNKQGPYYIHCLEGKDRTGFVCILLESLANATYEELENDYMITYYNYYGIDENSTPDKYHAYLELKFDDIIDYLRRDNNSIFDGAVRYLQDGGMSEVEIDELLKLLIDESK